MGGAFTHVLCWLVALALAFPPFMVAESIVAASVAEAQTYAVGNAKYQKGDFAGAEKALSQALSKKQSAGDRAKSLKLLGICQFMLGKKGPAEATFKKALALDAKTSIGQDEVLDDSVIPFFSSVKAKSKPGKTAKASPKAAPKATAKAAAPAPLPQTPPGGTNAAGGSAKPLKQTFVKVVSNVPSAQVLIDGIIAGQVNTLINTDPGSVELEVQAAGYITRKVSLSVAKNRENSVTINLSKPQPKPKPKPKPKPAPVAKAKPQGGGYAVAGGGKQQKKKPQGAAYAPKPADDLFGEEPVGGGGGDYGGGGQPAGPDLATQFQMDAGGGGGGYMAPPGYGPQPMGYGGYPQQPMYYAPPPQMYYAPPPPPPPPIDPYGGGGDPYAGGAPADPYAAGPADPAAGDASGGGSGGGKNEKNFFLAIMPFGIGQFQNKSYMLGLFFLGAEGAALYYWQSQTKLADDTVKTANAYITAHCATQEQTGTTLTQSEQVSKEKCDEYRASSSKFVDEKRKAATMGIAAFGVLWIGGAIEAVMHDPPAAKGKKKKSKKRKYSGFGAVSDDYDEVAEWAPDEDDRSPYHLLQEAAERRPEMVFRWDLGLLPPGAAPLPASGYDQGSGTSESGGDALLRPGIALDLRWTF